MFESCVIASAFFFLFSSTDSEPLTNGLDAAILSTGNSVLGWCWWIALGAAVNLVTRRRNDRVRWTAIVSILNVPSAFGLLLVVRAEPLLT